MNKDLYFFKDFIYLFLDRGEGKEKEGEKHQCAVASHTPPTGDLTWPAIQALCPDWESNWQPFGSQAGTQFTEPHRPEKDLYFLYKELLQTNKTIVEKCQRT